MEGWIIILSLLSDIRKKKMTILYWLNFIYWLSCGMIFLKYNCNYIRILFPNFLCISQIEKNFSLILTNFIILWTISSQMQFQSIIILVLPNIFCVIFHFTIYKFTIISFLLNIISNNIFPKFLSIACRKKKNVKNNFSLFNKLHAYSISNFLTDAIIKAW